MLFLFQFQHLTVLSIELHTESRHELCPDPDIDAIQAIFYSILNDIPPKQGQRELTGVIIIDPLSASPLVSPTGQGTNQKPSSSSTNEKPSTSSTNEKPSTSSASSSTNEKPSCSAANPSSQHNSIQQQLLDKAGLANIHVTYVHDEKQLITEFINFVRQ